MNKELRERDSSVLVQNINKSVSLLTNISTDLSDEAEKKAEEFRLSGLRQPASGLQISSDGRML